LRSIVGPADQYNITWYKRHSFESSLYDKQFLEDKNNRSNLNASLNSAEEMIGFCWLDNENDCELPLENAGTDYDD